MGREPNLAVLRALSLFSLDLVTYNEFLLACMQSYLFSSDPARARGIRAAARGESARPRAHTLGRSEEEGAIPARAVFNRPARVVPCAY